MSEFEAVALAIALGIGLGASINRQMLLQKLASRMHEGACFFTRITQGALSITLLMAAALLAHASGAITVEGFMTVTLAITFAQIWMQRTARSRLLR